MSSIGTSTTTTFIYNSGPNAQAVASNARNPGDMVIVAKGSGLVTTIASKVTCGGSLTLVSICESASQESNSNSDNNRVPLSDRQISSLPTASSPPGGLQIGRTSSFMSTLAQVDPNRYYLSQLVDEWTHEVSQLEVGRKDGKFLNSVNVFYRNYFTNCPYYLDFRKDGSNETVCSVTDVEMLNIKKERSYYLGKFPILNVNSQPIIVNKANEEAVETVILFFETLYKNLGPFTLNSLGGGTQVNGLNTTYVIGARNVLEVPYKEELYSISNLRIKYNAERKIMDVFCDATNCKHCHDAFTDLSFEQVIKENRGFDFSAVMEELPDTLGGQFIKSYIISKI